MAGSVRKHVAARAGNRCEYCRIPQVRVPYLRFWLEHIIPFQHGGENTLSNLALSCPWCNRHKGTNLSAIDSVTRQIVVLFNPRTQVWKDHFRLEGPIIVGLTPIGRATAELLRMNDKRRLSIRRHIESSIEEMD